MAKAFVLSAPRSGGGKTTVTMALLGALKKAGHAPAALKVGPDYIDPMFHKHVLGLPTGNIDLVLMGALGAERVLTEKAADAKTLVIEGVMGLYDGKGEGLDNGSTAHLARTLDLPVVFVIDPTGMAQSILALLSGFMKYDPRVKVAGVILNKVKPRSVPYYRHMIEKHLPLRVYGYLPDMEEVHLPSRHLGLVTPEEREGIDRIVERLSDTALKTMDLTGLMALGTEVTPKKQELHLAPPARGVAAIASDAAFNFVYDDVHRWFEKRGFTVKTFSPLSDREIPVGTTALYLPGGYPELHLEALSKNTPMLDAVRTYLEGGGACYAECGGMMYLAETVEEVPLVGFLPLAITMTDRLQDFGYRHVRWAGLRATGHSFHHSVAEMTGEVDRWYETDRGSDHWRVAGYHKLGAYACYVHLHFTSATEILERIFLRGGEDRDRS